MLEIIGVIIVLYCLAMALVVIIGGFFSVTDFIINGAIAATKAIKRQFSN